MNRLIIYIEVWNLVFHGCKIGTIDYNSIIFVILYRLPYLYGISFMYVNKYRSINLKNIKIWQNPFSIIALTGNEYMVGSLTSKLN